MIEHDPIRGTNGGMERQETIILDRSHICSRKIFFVPFIDLVNFDATMKPATLIRKYLIHATVCPSVSLLGEF